MRSMIVLLSALLLVSSVAGLRGRAEVNAEDVVFQLFTKDNPTSAEILRLNDDQALASSSYNNTWPTKIIAHGHYGSPTLAYSIRNAYLANGDYNIISVDWSVLAAGEYLSVTQNGVPTAGITTGEFINYLIANETPLDAFHLLGFDIGAHVVGVAGAAVKSGAISRITGLDPSAAEFPLEAVENRLDITDALVVDVIHTQVTYSIPIGHVDFYPNGGFVQPGCSDPDITCCSHCRVMDLFAESISNPTGFDALRCNNWETYLSGACDSNNHAFMGDNVNINARGSFFLATNEQSPYARG